MSLVFLLIKIFPIFGVSFGVVFLDLARGMRRTGGRAWIGMAALASVMFVLTAAWIFFRGDRNGELWTTWLLNWIRMN